MQFIRAGSTPSSYLVYILRVVEAPTRAYIVVLSLFLLVAIADATALAAWCPTSCRESCHKLKRPWRTVRRRRRRRRRSELQMHKRMRATVYMKRLIVAKWERFVTSRVCVCFLYCAHSIFQLSGIVATYGDVECSNGFSLFKTSHTHID